MKHIDEWKFSMKEIMKLKKDEEFASFQKLVQEGREHLFILTTKRVYEVVAKKGGKRGKRRKKT